MSWTGRQTYKANDSAIGVSPEMDHDGVREGSWSPCLSCQEFKACLSWLKWLLRRRQKCDGTRAKQRALLMRWTIPSTTNRNLLNGAGQGRR
jgi:hypothetical protein